MSWGQKISFKGIRRTILSLILELKAARVLENTFLHPLRQYPQTRGPARSALLHGAI